MAYTELIKSFERIRDYMREFYVYGFKSRTEYEKKSPRSYDNERRRIESYLGDYMGFRQTSAGKNVFLSIDSREVSHNPLYKVLKAKSFTNGDITLHFILFDILYVPDIALSLPEILDMMDGKYLSVFQKPMIFDESTVRKKLKEYVNMGLIAVRKEGKRAVYSRTRTDDLSAWEDALSYFSETAPLGVIGSFLLDKMDEKPEYYSFKHHYITHALESEILYQLFEAISEKRAVKIQNFTRKKQDTKEIEIIPLKIFISVQNGRQYVCGYCEDLQEMKFYRLDYITKVKALEVSEQFDALRDQLKGMQEHMWGVCLKNSKRTEHVEFTVHIGEQEEYIYNRLIREKRCGTVERIDKNTCRFYADVYDTGEMIPWIRTFICRIRSIHFSNRTIENQFKQDISRMYRLYGLGEDANDFS